MVQGMVGNLKNSSSVSKEKVQLSVLQIILDTWYRSYLMFLIMQSLTGPHRALASLEGLAINHGRLKTHAYLSPPPFPPSLISSKGTTKGGIHKRTSTEWWLPSSLVPLLTVFWKHMQTGKEALSPSLLLGRKSEDASLVKPVGRREKN